MKKIIITSLILILILISLIVLNWSKIVIKIGDYRERSQEDIINEPSQEDETNYSVNLQKCITLTTPSNQEYYESIKGSFGEEYDYNAYGRGIHCPYLPLSDKQYVLINATPSLCPDSNKYLGETLMRSLVVPLKPTSLGYYGKDLSKPSTFQYYDKNNPSEIIDMIQYSCFPRDDIFDPGRIPVESVTVVCCETN
jgi:hypothetical protein